MKKLFCSFLLLFAGLTSMFAVETNVIDTTLSTYTNVYLGADGKAIVALNANDYRTGKDSVYISQVNFDCTNIGDTILISISISDTSVTPLNTYFNKTTHIIPKDTIAPVIAVKAAGTLYLNAQGKTVAKFADFNTTSWDSCGIDYNNIRILPDSSYDCTDVGGGFKYIYFKIPDFSENIDSSNNVLVQIKDTLSPSLILKTDTFHLDALSKQVTVNFASIDNGSMDNCGLDSAQINNQNTLTFTCADTGWQKIIVKLYDINTNVSTDSISVYITDTVKPTYVKSNVTVYLNPDSAVISRSDIISNLSGNCFTPSFAFVSDSVFKCNATGVNTVKFTVNKITDSVEVTVLDTIKPQLITISSVANVGSTFNDTVYFNQFNLGSKDNCGIDSAQLNGASYVVFNCNDVGITKIEVKLFDLAGNITVDSVQITVLDTSSIQYDIDSVVAYLNPNSATISRAQFLSITQTNCNPNAITIDSDTIFSCTELGAKYIKFTIKNGVKTANDSAYISVRDTLKPTLQLQSNTVYLNASLNGKLIFADIDSNSFDNCTLDSAQLNGKAALDFDCSHLGPQKVVVQLFDLSGNSSKDSVIVFVADTNNISYSVNPVTVYLDDDSSFVKRSDLINIHSSGCSVQLSILSDTTFDCSNAANTNYVRFLLNGAILDSTPIMVLDTINPTLKLKEDTLYLDQNYSTTLLFSNINNGSADNCALDSAQLNGMGALTYGCSDTGSQKVVVTLFDASGKSTLDSTKVYVIDTIAPIYTKTPYTAYLTDDSTVVNRSNIISGIGGSCNAPSFTFLSDTIFHCSDVSASPHYVKFKLGINPADSVPVTVVDSIKPSAILISAVAIVGPSVSDTIRFSNINLGSHDNCAIDSAQLNGSSYLTYSCSDLGSQKVKVSLFDVHGNWVEDSVNVTVIDTIKPSYTKTAVTAYIQSDSIAISRAQFLNNVSGGCQSPTVNITSDTIFNCSTIGNTAYIQFELTNGFITIADSIEVTVLDTLKPVSSLKTDTFYLAGTQVTVNFSSLDFASQDNCGLDSAQLNGLKEVIFGCNDLGSQKIIVDLYDLSGNTIKDSVIVWVADTTVPAYNKLTALKYLSGDSVTVSRNELINITGGGCQTTLSIESDTVFYCSSAQSNPNFVRFKVNNGALDSSAVFVLDTVKPVLSINPVTVYLDQNFEANVTFQDIDNSSTDNCFIDSASLNNQGTLQFVCADTGLHAVTIRLYDLSGNVRIGSTTVTVKDTNNPVYAATPFTAYINSNNVSITRNDIISGLSDNCKVPSFQFLSDTTFSCADIASSPHYVKFTLNNLLIDSSEVTIVDTAKPTILIKSDSIYLDQNFSASLTFNDIDFGSKDNCGLDSATLNGHSSLTLNCSDTGVSSFSVTLYDIHGNKSTQTGSVLVIDTNTASYTATPVSAYLNTDSVVITQSQFLNVQASCTPHAVTILSDSIFYCSSMSINPNYLKFQVQGHALDSIAVTILDTVKPKLLLGIDTIFLGANGNATLHFSDIDRGSYDNCAIDSALLNGNSTLTYGCNNTGTNFVFVILYDVNGNVSFGSTSIEVIDTNNIGYTKTPVTAYVQSNYVKISRSDVITNLTGICQSPTFNFISDTTFYCSDINKTNYVKFLISGTILDSTLVTVADTTEPNLIIKPDTVYLNQNFIANASFNNVNNGSYDNCAIDSALLDGETALQFGCNDLGVNAIYVQLYDIHGNMSGDITSIFVMDTVQPTYTKVPAKVYLSSSGDGIVSRGEYLQNVVGNCSTSDVSILSDTTYDCNDAQSFTNYVKFMVNNVLDSTAITVIDSIAPKFSTIAPLDTFYLDSASGQLTLDFFDIATTLSDNCQIDSNSFLVFPNQFGCPDAGTTPIVTLSVSDIYGNKRSRQLIIAIESKGLTVNSTINGPTAACNNSYNVKYAVDNPDANTSYQWQLTGGTIISQSFKGREIYVRWWGGNSGSISLSGNNPVNCLKYQGSLNIALSGHAPDTAKIAYWNYITKNTLIAEDHKVHYYQWGYDEWVGGTRQSNILTGENKGMYYNPDLRYNIENADYIYWCETSYDSICWTRSYFNSAYPVTITEIAKQNYLIWPNPFKDYIDVEAEDEISIIELYDLYGRLIKRHSVVDKRYTLNNLNELAEGNYLLLIRMKNGEVYKTKILHTK